MKNVIVIDYGLSNLLSVQNAFSHFGVEVKISSSPLDINKADVLILPGVGAFKDGMDGLKSCGLMETLKRKVEEGVPLLGICLGMQMLFEKSEEFGLHDGLGFIPGRVVKIPRNDIEGNMQKVPHISWNPLYPLDKYNDFSGCVLENIKPGEECYFIHSYEAKPEKDEYRLADTVYGGRRICAVAQYKNVIGMQFHPEKSGAVGLAIIKKFIEKYC